MKRLYYFIRYCFIFARELILANFEVARLVLSPKLKFRPGFLAIPLDARSDFEITSLANSITLTPGTITVHIETEKNILVIHALDIGTDPDAVRRSIKTVESNILKWTRSNWPPASPDASASPPAADRPDSQQSPEDRS